jgi:hypothetical protein
VSAWLTVPGLGCYEQILSLDTRNIGFVLRYRGDQRSTCEQSGYSRATTFEFHRYSLCFLDPRIRGTIVGVVIVRLVQIHRPQTTRFRK